MSEETAKLKLAIRDTLFPFLEEKGFEKQFEKFSKSAKDFDFIRVYEGQVQVMAVQFDAHEKPRLVIEAADIPEEGFTNKHGVFLTKENVSIGSLFNRARLQAKQGPNSSCWFRTDGLLNNFKSNRIEACVEATIEKFPQLEEWWNSKKVGPNIHAINME